MCLVVTWESRTNVCFVQCFVRAFVSMQPGGNLFVLPLESYKHWLLAGGGGRVLLCPTDLQPDSHFRKTGFGYLGSVKIALVSWTLLRPEGFGAL